MERKIRVVQYGCGRMGSVCMKFAYKKGMEVIGAYDMNPELFGVGIDDYAGIKGSSVKIHDAKKFKEDIGTLKPDIVVVTTLSLVKDVYSVLMICADNGVNAITTCEEALYPWNSSPKLTEKLDATAKKTGATITGSGAQELQWGSTVRNLSGGMNNISKIVGVQLNSIDEYGIAFALSFGAGMTVDEFEAKFGEQNNWSDAEIQNQIEKGEFLPSFMWNSNTWLAKRLGLTVVRQEQKLIPEIAEKNIYSSTLEREICKGEVKGATSLVRTYTKEGIEIQGGVKAIVCRPDEFEENVWIIYDGDTAFETKQEKPPTVELTCSTITNRIPDVINAEAGYVTTDRMPDCTYLIKSAEQYIKKIKNNV